MKHNHVLLLLLCVMPALSGFAQNQPQNLTLQDAIDFALEHNRIVKNAERDIEAAVQQKWEATASGLPHIDARIDYQNFLKQQVSLIPAEFFGGNAGEFAEVSFGTKQNLNATATLKQQLFDGTWLVGLQSSKVFLDISKNAKYKTDLEVRKSVINAYGNVLLAEESIQILENNKTILEKNLNETQKIYDNGLTDEESVEQLQITLADISNQLNRTKRLKNVADKLFNITIGADINNPVNLKEGLIQLTSQQTVLSLLDADANVENTVDYKIADNDKRSKELLLKLEKSKALPKVSAFLNGGYMGNNDSFSFFQRDQKWFGSSLLGASVEIPIFSSFERHAATQRAKINLEKSEADLLETSEQLKLQIISAKSDYQFAIEQFDTSKQNLNLAERIERKNQIKYTEGLASSFELRQAQTQLYSIQNEYLQSMLNVITTKAELETVLNEIPKN